MKNRTLTTYDLANLARYAFIEARLELRLAHKKQRKHRIHKEFVYLQQVYTRHIENEDIDDQEINVVSNVVDKLDITLEAQSILADIHYASEAGSIASIVPFEKELNALGLFSKLFLPIQLTIGGLIALWKIYSNLYSNQTPFTKGLKIGVAAVSIGIAIVCVLQPEIALILGIVAVATIIGRDIYLCYEAQFSLSKERAKLAEYRQKLQDLYEKPEGTSIEAREKYYKYKIAEQQKIVQEHEAARNAIFTDSAFNLTAGIAAVLFAIPFTMPIGAGLLLGTLVVKIAQESGFINWTRRLYSRIKDSIFKPDEPEQDELAKTDLGFEKQPLLGKNQADIYKKIGTPQKHTYKAVELQRLPDVIPDRFSINANRLPIVPISSHKESPELLSCQQHGLAPHQPFKM